MARDASDVSGRRHLESIGEGSRRPHGQIVRCDGQQVTVAGNDRVDPVRPRECDEVVVVRIFGCTWGGCGILEAESPLCDERDEHFGAAIGCGSFELSPSEHSPQLRHQQRRNERFDVAVKQRFDDDGRGRPSR
ncbi:MAG TPA: hypothetical protein VK506_13535 [Conexibacter sp.]|nr:hypothetical protein [Conexibacter sp.]